MNDAVIETNVEAGIIQPERKIELEGAVVLDLVFTLRDKNGNVTNERFEQGHSFLANFIKLLYCNAMRHHAPYADGAALSLVDTGGTARAGSGAATAAFSVGSGGLHGCAFRANAGTGTTGWGILVGTDDGTILPKDINNYALGAKIAHGTGSGELTYGDTSIVPSTHDGASYSYAGITRSFSNGSGANIDVNEIGFATYFYWDTSTYRYFLLSRDILDTPVTVPDGQAMTASIRIRCYC